MKTPTRVSLDEYLQRRFDYEPEPELIGGELIQRPRGTREHSFLQGDLLTLLQQRLGAAKRACVELSMRVGEDVRIPDLSVISQDARFERRVLTDPPLLCVEILSPDQRLSTLFRKCEAYHEFGVPYCWVIDPERKTAWEYHRESTVSGVAERLGAGEIHVELKELFG